ncbi:MAG: galactose mutarotase [Donghicola eburneus]|nr:aldose epimerase family protein [Donghicola eburneus]MCI5041281.1 galactose mutarotase [Donghicola eburneus]
MTKPTPFGQLPDGTPVEGVTLRAGVAEARVITFGAALQSLVLPDRAGHLDDVVLGHDDLSGYVAHRKNFGATVGRVANRIAKGQFTLDGQTYQLPQNNGPNTLHGGPEGFDRRNWRIVDLTSASVTLELTSPDGDQGFPGAVTVQTRYELQDREGGVRLGITYKGETTAPTPLAMTHHSYFALAGHGRLRDRPSSALEYDLEVPASRYLPTDAHQIPLGPAPVGATPFDFREGRRCASAIRAGALEGYDHCLCLDVGRAILADPVSGRRMRLTTNQQGLQVYTSNAFDGSIAGKSGVFYQPYDAICLEPQAWPNAVNMAADQCPCDVILRPSDTYRSVITLDFDTI